MTYYLGTKWKLNKTTVMLMSAADLKKYSYESPANKVAFTRFKEFKSKLCTWSYEVSDPKNLTNHDFTRFESAGFEPDPLACFNCDNKVRDPIYDLCSDACVEEWRYENNKAVYPTMCVNCEAKNCHFNKLLCDDCGIKTDQYAKSVVEKPMLNYTHSGPFKIGDVVHLKSSWITAIGFMRYLKVIGWEKDAVTNCIIYDLVSYSYEPGSVPCRVPEQEISPTFLDAADIKYCIEHNIELILRTRDYDEHVELCKITNERPVDKATWNEFYLGNFSKPFIPKLVNINNDKAVRFFAFNGCTIPAVCLTIADSNYNLARVSVKSKDDSKDTFHLVNAINYKTLESTMDDVNKILGTKKYETTKNAAKRRMNQIDNMNKDLLRLRNNNDSYHKDITELNRVNKILMNQIESLEQQYANKNDDALHNSHDENQWNDMMVKYEDELHEHKKEQKIMFEIFDEDPIHPTYAGHDPGGRIIEFNPQTKEPLLSVGCYECATWDDVLKVGKDRRHLAAIYWALNSLKANEEKHANDGIEPVPITTPNTSNNTDELDYKKIVTLSSYKTSLIQTAIRWAAVSFLGYQIINVIG